MNSQPSPTKPHSFVGATFAIIEGAGPWGDVPNQVALGHCLRVYHRPSRRASKPGTWVAVCYDPERHQEFEAEIRPDVQQRPDGAWDTCGYEPGPINGVFRRSSALLEAVRSLFAKPVLDHSEHSATMLERFIFAIRSALARAADRGLKREQCPRCGRQDHFDGYGLCQKCEIL